MNLEKVENSNWRFLKEILVTSVNEIIPKKEKTEIRNEWNSQADEKETVNNDKEWNRI